MEWNVLCIEIIWIKSLLKSLVVIELLLHVQLESKAVNIMFEVILYLVWNGQVYYYVCELAWRLICERGWELRYGIDDMCARDHK